MIRQTGTTFAGAFLMPTQPALPGLRDAIKKKVTRREQFLTEMASALP
jgi:transposase, IS5 family